MQVDRAVELRDVQAHAELAQVMHEEGGPRQRPSEAIDPAVDDPVGLASPAGFEDLAEVVSAVEVGVPAEVQHGEHDPMAVAAGIAVLHRRVHLAADGLAAAALVAGHAGDDHAVALAEVPAQHHRAVDDALLGFAESFEQLLGLLGEQARADGVPAPG